MKYLQPRRLLLTCVLLFVFLESVAKPAVKFSLAAGDAHTCAKLDERLECWGDNYYSQLDVPTSIILKPIAIAATSSNSCAIDLFHVHCWGISVDVFLAATDPMAVSVGNEHVCKIEDSAVACMRGANQFGELDVPAGIENPTDIASGPTGTCAIGNFGIECWGRNIYGELSPPVGLQNVTLIALGFHHACALADGQVVCWGENDIGQTDVPENLGEVIELEAGFDNTCALSTLGVVCWGSNSFDKSSVPLLTNPISIAVGTHHTCAMANEGIKCWGLNNWGQASPPLAINNAFLALGPTRELLSLPLPDESVPRDEPVGEEKNYVVVPPGLLRDRELSRLLPSLLQLIHQ